MKSIEAREYFRTLGTLHCEARALSSEDGKLFLETERQTEEYQLALTTLKLGNPFHCLRESETEMALMRSLTSKYKDRLMDEVYDSGSSSRIRRLEALIDARVDAFGLARYINDAEEARVLSKNEGFTAYILLLGVRRYLASTSNALAQVNGRVDPNSDAGRANEFNNLANFGSLSIKAEGVSLNDFAQEQFRDKRKVDYSRIKTYLQFFMRLGMQTGKTGEEDIQDENCTRILIEHPYSVRCLIRETGMIALSFYDLGLVEPHKFLGGFREFSPTHPNTMKRIIEEVNQCKKQFTDFTDRVWELVFNPKLEGSEEIRQVLKGYLKFDDRSALYILTMMGAGTTPVLIGAYRDCIDLIEAGHDPEFYNFLASEIEGLIERYCSGWVQTLEDLETIVTGADILGNPNKTFSDIGSIVRGLRRIPHWQDFDIKEVDVPWAELGIKKPSAIELIFPISGHLNFFTFNLEYQNKYGESTTVSLEIDVSKRHFYWSILQAPPRNPDLVYRFLAVVKTLLSGIYQKLNPQDGRVTVVSSAAFPLSTVPEAARPSNLEQHIQPTEIKRRPQKSETPLKLISLEDTEKTGIKDQIAVPDETALASLLSDIPNNQKEMVRRRIDEFNALGRGKFKRLGSAGLNGERQYSLRTGDYRILLLEYEFNKGKKVYRIRNIGHRNEIYDEVDN